MGLIYAALSLVELIFVASAGRGYLLLAWCVEKLILTPLLALVLINMKQLKKGARGDRRRQPAVSGEVTGFDRRLPQAWRDAESYWGWHAGGAGAADAERTPEDGADYQCVSRY